jgi:hypothetical protein
MSELTSEDARPSRADDPVVMRQARSDSPDLHAERSGKDPSAASAALTPDLFLDKSSLVHSYRALLADLQSLALPSLTHIDAWSRREEISAYLCIRHDVDHDLEIAVRMARIEHEMGIQASYYLLPPGDYGKDENYYGRIDGKRIIQSARLREGAQEIAALGHEIGLHNDFVQLSLRLQRPAAELILEQIAFFRGAGIPIRGSASHGSKFARAHGYVNLELFAECRRRGREEATVSIDVNTVLNLHSVSMNDLGLEYEAYSLQRDAYISDSGSSFTVNGNLIVEPAPPFVRELLPNATRVIALIHPDWWQVVDDRAAAGPESAANHSSEAVTTAPRFVRKDRRPFRIAMRGDATSRRSVVLNADFFPRGTEIIQCARCPFPILKASIDGRAPGPSAAAEVSVVENMQATQRRYYESQFDHGMLQAADLDLVIFDDFADMYYELWRNRAEGSLLWIHPSFLRDAKDFRARFEAVGRSSLLESTEAAVAVIDHLRLANPDVPVLFLQQPTEFHQLLSTRVEFRQLSLQVASQRPYVYTAEPIAREALRPADIGSSGPGQTIHFEAETYRSMIQAAWNNGLQQHFRRGSRESKLTPASSSPSGAAR